MQGPGDQYGNPNLSNPGKNITVGGDYDPYTTNFSANNYKLTAQSTKAIGKASNGSSVNGYNVTPLTPSTDFFGATRGNPACIGFHEFDGEITESVDASFTIDDNLGEAPHCQRDGHV